MSEQDVPVLTRTALIEQLEAAASGKLSAAKLAKWSFDRFYAEELGEEAYEEGAEDAIADVLDSLMFGDEPGFALEVDELRALVRQLQ